MKLDDSTMPSFGGARLDPIHISAPQSHALQHLIKLRSCFQFEIATKIESVLSELSWTLMTVKGHHHKPAFGVRDRQLHQGVCDFIVREMASGQDKAGRASLALLWHKHDF